MSSKTSTDNRPSARPFHWLGVHSFLARVLLVILILVPAGVARAAPIPGFIELKVFDGLDQPTAVQFAADGRVFVAEKSGIIKVFDNLADTTPTIFADLNVQVHNWWDRGLLDLKLAPGFPSDPYVYVSYTYDAEIGGTAPRWGTPGVYSDPCPDECIVSGRVSRLQASGNVMTGSEQVLIEDWCQQYPSHSIGSLAFGTDGALYVSGGEGASFGLVDYGQTGDPVNNPCGDPPGGVGGVQIPPTAEGGALRSQDLRTSGDPVGLGGTILRVNPATGAALPDNPLAGNSDPNARRIIAYGLRNPFRTAIRPGTNEVWVGDVGWLDWEEINRITNPTDAVVENFGWPCYEGVGRHAGYDSADLNICEGLYGQAGAVTTPYLAYHHDNQVVPGETCSIGSSSTAGLAFYAGGNYPAEYQGALFFADYSRRCIWAMLKDASGVPSPGLVQTFVAGAAAPVDLEIGPGGDLFYVALSGSVRRIQYTGGGGGGSLPSPWSSQDIGSVGVVGSASFSNGIFTVRGSGADIGGTADAFHYAYQPMSGDGSITARVGTLTLKSDAAAKAGVMIRESLSANTRSAAVVVMRSNGVAFVRRLTTGGSSVSTAGAAVVAPYWVRLVRSGATFSAYQSSDGVNWVLVGTDTISMGQDVFVGLPVTSRNNTTSTTATFDNVNVAGPPATNQPPVASIDTPEASTTWKVSDVINFSGSAIDPEDETLPPSAMTWALILHHCPSNCHEHPLQTFSGVASGSFTAPDHEFPSHLELRLTVTDSGGLQDTDSVLLDPQTVELTFLSTPSGLQLTVGATSEPAPFTRTVIVGSANSISAPTPQTLGGITYQFDSWSDGGAQTHTIVAPASPTTFVAEYIEGGPPPTNQPPTATINTPSAGTTWKVGDAINFSGAATDPEDGNLPPSAMSWTLTLQHCAPTCHAHLLQTFPGVASGSFTAPDHEYPSFLELQLTVTDSGSLQDTETLRLDPQTVVLTFQSTPSGLQLTVGSTTNTATFTRTVIVGSTNSISAPSPQTLGGTTYQFTSWSDGGSQTHNIVAPASPTTYTAQYVATTPGGVTSTGFLAPSADGPETVKAGDNNGYEVSPGNAYAADGLVATDANSGTNPVTSCTSPHKDKHRYYNYNFNIPAMTALKGIEVRLTGNAATTTGTPKICIQLSWSRGDTWTDAQSIPLTTVNTTYVLGSPTDTWGRNWMLGDFSNTNFRVRVIDVASSTDNTFSLDAIAVNITYQP